MALLLLNGVCGISVSYIYISKLYELIYLPKKEYLRLRFIDNINILTLGKNRKSLSNKLRFIYSRYLF